MIEELDAKLAVAPPIAFDAKAIETLRAVEQFLYYEARLQDQHAYDEWESLWTDDAVYWVPANGEDTDPETQMSYIYDNRSRIGVRIKQLKTGKRHTQTPRSQLARIISNIELLSDTAEGISVRANAMIYEESLRGVTIWAARNEYRLRRAGNGFKLVRKKIVLVNNNKPIYTLSFLV